MLAEADKAAPLEACGLLLGTRTAEGWRVERIVPTANVHAHPTRFFEIDPATLIAAHRAARSGGAQVLGCYHSHPSGRAWPSAADAAAAAGDRSVWAIIAGGEIRFYRSDPDGFRPLAYVLSLPARPS